MRLARWFMLCCAVLYSCCLAHAGVANVNCTAKDSPAQVIDGHTGEVTTQHNWRVDCKITIKDEVIYDKPLVLPEHASLSDALDAIQKFQNEKAPEIVKEHTSQRK